MIPHMQSGTCQHQYSVADALGKGMDFCILPETVYRQILFFLIGGNEGIYIELGIIWVGYYYDSKRLCKL